MEKGDKLRLFGEISIIYEFALDGMHQHTVLAMQIA